MYPPKWLKITLLFLFQIVIPFATSLSFNFTSFDPDADNITYEQNAYAVNNVIQLTQPHSSHPKGGTTGRINYDQPFHLWDKASGYLANFSTNFSFSSSITNYAGPVPGGSMLSFFLAPNGTNGTSSLITTYASVEFGMPSNSKDSIFNGTIVIDINNSRTEMSLLLDEDWNHDVWISYDSKSKNLSVVCTGLVNGSQISSRLSRVVDLGFHLPEFVTLGFSAWSYSLFLIRNIETIRSWSFMSSTLELKTVNQTDTQVTTPVLNSWKRNNNNGLLIGLAIGVTVFVLLMGLLTYCIRSKIKMTVNGGPVRLPSYDELEHGSCPKQFTYKDLKKATKNFSPKNKLGEGGFGCVYSGSLKMRIPSKIRPTIEYNLKVAVKKISDASEQGIKHYESEVKIISRLRHKHLVELFGWCHEKKKLLLVYDFMPERSLDIQLFRTTSVLSWERRFRIAKGLAAALLYLHEECKQWVVHRDIKSSNIMLDNNFDAKLGDFGLARLVDHEKESPTTTDMQGSHGYIAPEYMDTRKASKESDVYSFGVVALEIACGRKSICPKAEQGQINLVKWVWSLYGTGRILDSADPVLETQFNSNEMKQLMIVGLWCTHPNYISRPSIKRAARTLSFEADLPVLPLKMPVPVDVNVEESRDVYFKSENYQ